MTNLLIFGSGGQLGYELMRAGQHDGLERTGLERSVLDITDPDAVANAIRHYSPKVVINAAAYTNVDGAEDDRETAFAVNAHAPGRMAKICKSAGAALIHFSTDYVFDGEKAGAYREDDAPRPVNIYGQSKLEGETFIRNVLDRHLIIRTSWMFGVRGRNFVKTIFRLAQEKDRLTMVDNQYSRPTAAKDLAQAVLAVASAMSDNTPWGTYHFAGVGATSWYGFATSVIELSTTWLKKCPEIEPITMSDYPTQAQRPPNTIMNCGRFTKNFAIKPASWRDDLEEVVAELAKNLND